MKTMRRMMRMMTMVKLANKNEEDSYQKMIPWCSLVLTKTKMMKNYPRTKPMVALTHQLRKYFKIQWLQPNLWITIQVPFKPSLVGYEIKLKCLMLPMSSMFWCIYNKNYNIRMSCWKVLIMNKVFFSPSNGSHMDLVAIY